MLLQHVERSLVLEASMLFLAPLLSWDSALRKSACIVLRNNDDDAYDATLMMMQCLDKGFHFRYLKNHLSETGITF